MCVRTLFFDKFRRIGESKLARISDREKSIAGSNIYFRISRVSAGEKDSSVGLRVGDRDVSVTGRARRMEGLG